MHFLDPIICNQISFGKFDSFKYEKFKSVRKYFGDPWETLMHHRRPNGDLNTSSETHG